MVPVSRHSVASSADNGFASQTKTIEVSIDALQSGDDPSLPPLMNPTMLEASDDLTNLSHLNEPAGKSLQSTFSAFIFLGATR